MTTTAAPVIEWHQRESNVLVLIDYMADEGATAKEVVYAVEKPWKHADVWAELCERYGFCAACGGPDPLPGDLDTAVHYEDCPKARAWDEQHATGGVL